MSGATVDDRPDTGSVPVVPGSRARKVRRAVIGVGAGLVAAVAAVVLAGLPLYVFPPSSVPESADLVYVIGPPTDDRLDLAQQLVDEGVADERLVIGFRKGNGLFEVEDMEVCREEGVTCAIPQPSTTKGEALILERYAPEHDIQSTIVITFTPHVARTRYIFDKCFDGDVTVVGVPSDMSLTDWAYQYAYQSAAFVKAWATPCAGDE